MTAILFFNFVKRLVICWSAMHLFFYINIEFSLCYVDILAAQLSHYQDDILPAKPPGCNVVHNKPMLFRLEV